MGFNGKIHSGIIRIGPGAFIEKAEGFTEWQEKYPVPPLVELGDNDQEL